MAVVAYLRVSTEKQFLENQREEIIRFAEKNGLSIDRWYMETVSGKVSSKVHIPEHTRSLSSSL